MCWQIFFCALFFTFWYFIHAHNQSKFEQYTHNNINNETGRNSHIILMLSIFPRILNAEFFFLNHVITTATMMSNQRTETSQPKICVKRASATCMNDGKQSAPSKSNAPNLFEVLLALENLFQRVLAFNQCIGFSRSFSHGWSIIYTKNGKEYYNTKRYTLRTKICLKSFEKKVFTNSRKRRVRVCTIAVFPSA